MVQLTLPDPTASACTLEALPRLAQLREETRAARVEVCLERARHLTTYLRDLADRTEPPTLQCAKALRCYLSNKAPRFFDANLLAGTTTSRRLGAAVHPESAARGWEVQACPLTPSEAEELKKRILPYWAVHPEAAGVPALLSRILAFIAEMNPGSLPWQRVVLERGLDGIMAEARVEEAFLRGRGVGRDSERLVFLQAVQEVLAGLVAYAANLGRFAGLLAVSETDGDRKTQLGAMSEVCAQVPAGPARTFREAVNAVWLLQVGLGTDVDPAGFPGRLDEILQPWLRKDLEEGILTETGALELLGCFWLKLQDHVDLALPRGREIQGLPDETGAVRGDVAVLAAKAAGLLEDPGAHDRRSRAAMAGLGDLWKVMGVMVGAGLRLTGAPSYR